MWSGAGAWLVAAPLQASSWHAVSLEEEDVMDLKGHEQEASTLSDELVVRPDDGAGDPTSAWEVRGLKAVAALPWIAGLSALLFGSIDSGLGLALWGYTLVATFGARRVALIRLNRQQELLTEGEAPDLDGGRDVGSLAAMSMIARADLADEITSTRAAWVSLTRFVIPFVATSAILIGWFIIAGGASASRLFSFGIVGAVLATMVVVAWSVHRRKDELHADLDRLGAGPADSGFQVPDATSLSAEETRSRRDATRPEASP
jgi:hypothetical protein